MKQHCEQGRRVRYATCAQLVNELVEAADDRRLAGRSQIAAGWLRHLAGDRVDVYSAGSAPAAGINPAAVAVMAEVGINIANNTPRTWTDDELRAADVVITMGCGDSCPIYPGTRHEDWDLDDPADLPAQAVRPIRDEIRTRVEHLIDNLELQVP